MKKLTVTAIAALALVAATAGQARAQDEPADSRAYFTFTTPVAVPGATLEPGEYMFRLADAHSGRKTVQVLSADGRNVYSMFFVNRIERRANPTAHAEVALGEAPEGTPRSISSWWMPGTLEGRTFLYSPGEASWERSVPRSGN